MALNGSASLRHMRVALLAIAFLLPLVVFPGLEQPFSRPKLVLWAIVVLGGLASCTRRLCASWTSLPQILQIALLLWLGVLGASAIWGVFASLESVILPLTGVGWLTLSVAVRPRGERLAWALVLSSTVIATAACGQFLGVDLFPLFGWIADSTGNPRMRVFATLGNPDFVAAFLVGLLPLTFSLASEARMHRRLLTGLSMVQALGILATGSRAPVPALVAAALWMVRLRRRKLGRAFALTTCGIAVLTLPFSPGRSLSTTLRGRMYIWKVSAPHLAEHFFVGLGPGGFKASFPVWEVEYWQTAQDERNREFAGVEDHAHNDYLEIFADYGAAGLLALLAVLFACLRIAWLRARSGSDPLVVGASAGVVALAAVSLVDFPMMRPTEVFLLWSLIAVSLLSGSCYRRTTNLHGARQQEVEGRTRKWHAS